jgi:acyl-CoA synthetase (NDP forming)
MKTIVKTSLDGLFKAEGIAIIGASSKKGKLGNQIVEFAKEMDFRGNIYPINPGSDSISGLKCYKTLNEIPGRIDIVAMVLNATECGDAAQKIAERKDEKGDISAVVVVTGGFSETGTEEGRLREKALLEPLISRGIRVIGPNCQGIIDTYHGINTTFDVGNYKKGGLSIISQSGALAVSFLMWGAPGSLLGLNKFVSLGNMSDVNVVDLMKYYAEDEQTNVIVLYLEGTRQGRELIETAAEVSKKKPVVAFKAGKTQTGSIAAASHTGSIAGSFEMYQGLFRQAGVIHALSVPEFYHTAAAFDKMPLPRGNKVCVLTVVGGPGTICVDELISSGIVELAKLSKETTNKLREILLPAANVGKPEGYIDMTGSVSEELHQEVFKIVLRDPNVHGMVYLTTPPAFLNEEALAKNIIAAYHSFPKEERKPVLSVFGYGYTVGKLRRIMEESGMPTLEYADIAAKVMANMIRYSQYRSRFNK